VDKLLPDQPDFLRGQIRRMNAGKAIEWPKGGIEKGELKEQDKIDIAGDKNFDKAVINDDYVKRLKAKQSEKIYVESNADRLLFTNSCWEI